MSGRGRGRGHLLELLQKRIDSEKQSDDNQSDTSSAHRDTSHNVEPPTQTEDYDDGTPSFGRAYDPRGGNMNPMYSGASRGLPSALQRLRTAGRASAGDGGGPRLPVSRSSMIELLLAKGAGGGQTDSGSEQGSSGLGSDRTSSKGPFTLPGSGRGESGIGPSNGSGSHDGISQLLSGSDKDLVSNSSKGDSLKHSLAKMSISGRSSEISEESLKSVNYFLPKDRSGSSGVPVELSCNYIRLKSDPNKGIFLYEVRFKPNVDASHLRAKLLGKHRDVYGGVKSFDGINLYLPVLLPDKLTTVYDEETKTEIRILFKERRQLKQCISLYNILFDRVMKTLKYVRHNRKQFDPSAPKLIPQAKLEIWPGYVTSVDEYDGGLMLCCDVSHRILCQKSVLEEIADIFMSDKERFQDNARKSLLGQVVITRYNNKTYRIDGIEFNKNPLSTFMTSTGKEISFLDYYRDCYNITIKDTRQPLLLSIKKVRNIHKQPGEEEEEQMIYIIPEIAYLTGLRDNVRSDFRLMQEIASFTRVTPNQRMEALHQFYSNINKTPEARKILEDWGLTLCNYTEKIVGRSFEEEQIYFKRNHYSAGRQAEFSKYALSNEVLETVPLTDWIVIYHKQNQREQKVFLENMERNTKSMGLSVCPPKVVMIQDQRLESFVQAIRSNLTKSVQMVTVIVPNQREDRYNAIKKICCTEKPVPSQVICARTLSKDNKARSIVSKIALQINCKLGGTLWSVKIPFRSVMIAGIDSYHDASQKGNSVAAFVASINKTFTRWYSHATIQTKKEEIIGGLAASFVKALAEYYNFNNELPESVIIYRDGVGDGQLPVCANHEIPQLERAAKAAFKNYTPKITFLVVQKRINTRYYQVDRNGGQNPNPGTVVDSVITRANMYDFFLVSQSVRQGTVSPSHFVVVRDDSTYKPDVLQRLSYKLTFLYYNWTGTIRIPACCQYAHKLAYLVGQNLRRNPADELCNKLFYL